MRLDVLRRSGYRSADRLNGRHIDTGRRYLISRRLIREKFGPGHIMPVAHLYRADGLRFPEFFLAIAYIFFYFLCIEKNCACICIAVELNRQNLK